MLFADAKKMTEDITKNLIKYFVILQNLKNLIKKKLFYSEKNSEIKKFH